MAAKRLRVGDDHESDELNEKRLRRIPSFATVIREAMTANSLQNLLRMIEPMLRRVVKEEVERGLIQGARSFPMSSPMQIQPEKPSSLRLIFRKPLTLPIFTSTKIEDEEGNPIQILLEDVSGEEERLMELPPSIKLEIVAIDGDFPAEEREDWTAEEFERSVVKERAGKRPLVTGDVSPTMKDRAASVEDLMITDNSSWIRCRHFRIAARVFPGSYNGLRIREAVTERFTVKDHRGELYKKSYPPSLNDEVWRLERIGKDGAFHKRLVAEKIETVQDFLKLWVVDPNQLRKILGQGMSDRTWEVTIGHATTCVLGNKHYLYRRAGSSILLNSICQVIGTVLNGISYPPRALAGPNKNYVEHMVVEAYRQWKSLEEVDETYGSTALLQSGMMLQGVGENSSAHQNTTMLPNYSNNVAFEMIGEFMDNGQVDFGVLYQTVASPLPAMRPMSQLYNTSEMSSDDDGSIISQGFFHGN